MSSYVSGCNHTRRRSTIRHSAILILGLSLLPLWQSTAQDVLRTLSGYKQYERMGQLLATNRARLASIFVTWQEASNTLEFRWEGKRFCHDIMTGQTREIPRSPTTNEVRAPDRPARSGRREPPPEHPARGRQYSKALSPDGKYNAIYRDRNLWLRELPGTNDVAITTEGNDTNRVKLGTATWTYGEELDQITAIWWSSNSQKVAFYRMDESQVPDYYLTLKQTRIQNQLDVEPYPKAGGTNPVVDVFIYDVASRKTVKVDVRDGKPFTDDVVGHYVYNVSWSADSRELLFHRTDRLQKVMELCAADPETGRCRVIVREEWLPSWVENNPYTKFLKDGRRFIWTSERTGWKNYYLYHLDGRLLAPLTDHCFEVANVVRVDEDRGFLYYMARSGDNSMKLQLHRVGLDGSGDVRLTDPAFHHTVSLSPSGRFFVDTAQTHDQPPVCTLRDAEGHALAELARSDISNFTKLHLRKVELFEFKAADGQTTLYGMLHFPSTFNPRKKYPLLLDIYAGPATSGARETFVQPNTITELGFLYANLDARSAAGRGKRFLDAIYQQLGKVEIDDLACGVQALARRKYVDGSRVGVYGTSYGGTASGLCLLRYPNVFKAACASSAVTDFRNYDTIYTERYLGLPQESPSAYDQVKLMTYVKNLKGRLMLFYGTADDNVHPSNTLQLVEALQGAGKSFDLQVGPDVGHASLRHDRMLEFFIQNLVLK
jgi:dipeptidyl-peptidase-4